MQGLYGAFAVDASKSEHFESIFAPAEQM